MNIHNKAILAAAILPAVSFTLIVIASSCGKITVDHEVTGTVQVQVQLSPALFVPFFLTDCQTRTPSQACYNTDPTVCATCMANTLFSTLPVPK